MLQKIHQVQTATELTRSISVLDAIYWTKQAWSDVTPGGIIRSYAKADFPINETEEMEEVDEDLHFPRSRLLQQIKCAT